VEKATRKQFLKQEDAFLAAAGQGAKWVATHRTAVILTAAGLAVVIGGAAALVEHTQHKNALASQLLTEGQKILAAQVVPAQADPHADPPTYASDEEKWRAAKAQFDKVVDQAGGSGVADLARLYRADLTARLGDVEGAQKQLQALCDRLSPANALMFLAIERLAYLQEGAGNLDRAMATWGRLAGSEGRFYSDYATFHQARLLAQKGEVEKARGLYQSFAQRFKESPLRDRVRDRLAALPPPAAQDQGPKENVTPIPKAGSR
jgi:predicted negative regulator of RcsB-dependent stress response